MFKGSLKPFDVCNGYPVTHTIISTKVWKQSRRDLGETEEISGMVSQWEVDLTGQISSYPCDAYWWVSHVLQ
jgi:hypothetical protein